MTVHEKESAIYIMFSFNQVLNEAIHEEDSEDSDTTEETAMLPEKGRKVVITNDTSARKSAEKRKSGNKICSEYYVLEYQCYTIILGFMYILTFHLYIRLTA